MPPPQATKDLYTTLQRYQLLLVLSGRRLWSRMSPTDFDRSWQLIAPSLVTLTSSAQLAAARSAVAYVPQVLEETGQPDEPLARIRPRAFAGVASDGRSLPGLLEGAVVAAKRAVAGGMAPNEALIGGQKWLEQALESAIADAMRDATAASVAVRPDMGWTRMVNPPCCSRCAVLAGKFYRWNEGFLRHPRCLPAGVTVSGPAMDAATRRWYDGELIVVRTASGKRLPITANHPVLTSKGWLPAHLIVEGDDVVRRASGDRAMGLVVPDQDQMPASVEDLWRSDSVTSLGRVPVSAEDFHGDGTGGHVDVVLTDGFLRRHVEAALAEQFTQQAFAVGAVSSRALTGKSATDQLGRAHLAATGGLMGGGDLLTQHFLRGVADARMSRFAPTADLGTSVYEPTAHNVAAHAERASYGVFALPVAVSRDQILGGELVSAPRWDAPAGPMTVESRSAYASRGQDLRLRLAGQVELDRVVDVSRVKWSGHVFNLSSSEGWYDANGIIVSNCDCIHIPSTENVAGSFTTDPNDLVRRGLITDLSENQRERLSDGADLSKVLNESRDRWRQRMAADRKAGKTWATNTPTAIPPGGVQNFLAHLTSQVDAANALRAAGIAD